MIATLQREQFVLPTDLRSTPWVLYQPPLALRWVFGSDSATLPPEDQPGHPLGDVVQSEPHRDGGRRLRCDVDDARTVTCVLDADGRPVSIEETQRVGRLVVEYEYDEEGRLHRETMVQFLSGELSRGLHAEHRYADGGARRSVEISDLSGRTVEVQSYGALGQLDECHTLNDACQVSCREQFQYDARGLLEFSHRQRFAAIEPWQPVRDWTETREYGPGTETLVRRTLVERKNDAEPDETPAWAAVVVEVIDYDPEQEGVPLRDETQYLDQGPFGAPILRKRILMNYRMIDPEGIEAIQVIDEDVCSGEIRERWCRMEA